MRFAVPIIYRPAKGKKMVASGTHVEVREITGLEAPVAIDMPITFKPDENREFRYFEGALWAARMKATYPYEPYPVTAEMMMPFRAGVNIGEEYVRQVQSRQYIERKFVDSSLFRPTDGLSRTLFYTPNVEPDISDDSDEALASHMARRYRIAAADHLFIDGKLFQRSAGPVLQIAPATSQRDAIDWSDGTVDLSPDRRYGTFRADELELAKAVTGEIFGFDLPVRRPPPVIHIPEALTANLLNAAIEGHAWTAIRMDKGLHMRDASREKVAAVRDLRKALTARWPDEELVFNGSINDIWPHEDTAFDFPPGDDLLPLIAATTYASPEVFVWRDRALRVLNLRHAWRNDQSLTAQLPDEDDDALDMPVGP